ncbi:MAG: RNA polymerase sigma factor [Gammaproteobacteria bacterium PRO9]|nr:RNA polymerase sigma factor [Gammaproteobacteria bacterium PRO9]
MERFLAEVERRALRIATLSVGNRDDACDILQDAMLRLVRNYGNRSAEEWRPLFYRILANRITDHQRRQSVRRRLFAWLAPDDEDEDPLAAIPDARPIAPEQLVGQSDAMAALGAALEKLAARQRQAFLLRNLEGLDVAETAIAMGCSEGSVKTHYSRAVHSLREQLGECGARCRQWRQAAVRTSGCRDPASECRGRGCNDAGQAAAGAPDGTGGPPARSFVDRHLEVRHRGAGLRAGSGGRVCRGVVAGRRSGQHGVGTGCACACARGRHAGSQQRRCGLPYDRYQHGNDPGPRVLRVA